MTCDSNTVKLQFGCFLFNVLPQLLLYLYLASMGYIYIGFFLLRQHFAVLKPPVKYVNCTKCNTFKSYFALSGATNNQLKR